MPRQITSPRIGHAEHKRGHYRAVLEHGTTVEDLTHPLFFMNIMGLRAGDLIEVVSEDLSAYGEVLVQSVDKTAVRVGLIRFEAFEEVEREPAPAEDFRIEFNAQDKHRVVRVSDGQVLEKDLATEAAAKRWITNHRKAL